MLLICQFILQMSRHGMVQFLYCKIICIHHQNQINKIKQYIWGKYYMYRGTLCILLSLDVLSFSVIHIITTCSLYICVYLVYAFILHIVFSFPFPYCFFPLFGSRMCRFFVSLCPSGFTARFLRDMC